MAEETTRIINLTEATETDSGMYFVTDSSNGTKKVSIETLIDSTLEEELAAAPAKSVGDNKADIETLQGQMETKAEIDGAYESMTVGNAEQLVSTVFSEDSQPYQFRPSGGSLGIGDREYDTLVGGDLVWNQLVNSTDTSVTVPSGHKYLSKISGVFALGNSNGTAITVDGASGDMVVDITQLFGSSTIPDYIYSLEQSTAGSGVAWLKKYLPNLFQYNEYTTPTIESVENVSAHEFVGFNQWDEEWELGIYNYQNGEPISATGRIRTKNPIPILPNTIYAKTSPSGGFQWMCFYDKQMNYVGFKNAGSGNTEFTTPDNAWYLNTWTETTYGGTYNHDMCINLSWDGERNGEYEPYKKWSYPISPAFGGHGIPKLDASGNLYFDGDRRYADGTVETRYGIVDLGTLDWAVATTPNNHWRFGASLSNVIRADSSSTVFNGICTKYQSVTPANTYYGITGISNNNATNTIYVCDETYTDATTFKTAMSGVYLVYELATPTTSETSTFQSPQKVDDWGTERYITDGVVPVGHETKYAPNLRAKLEMAPDSPSGDGDYIVRQTSGINAYAPLIQELPTKPSEDGTYTLKCTVSNGTATLSWEVEE